jgi:hypothetical protein
MLDMSWIRQYEATLHELYDFYPLHAIIETILSHPGDLNVEDRLMEIFYSQINAVIDYEEHFADDKIRSWTYDHLELQFELLIEILQKEIYDHIALVLPDISGYTFHQWHDPYSLTLIREDLARRHH